MKTTASIWAAAAAAAIVATGWPQAAHALLRAPVTSGQLASGLVNIDAAGPPLSSQESSATALPLAVSTVDVADSLVGTFDYRASADIGLLALKVFGSLTNIGGSRLGLGETPVMQVSAQVLDVITLQSASADPYEVTLELLVDGSIATAGGAAGASANAFIDFGLLSGANTADSARYGIGIIDDRLAVTKTVVGPIVQMDLEALLTFTVLTLDPGASVTGQLSNTALLRLVLPPNVSVVDSASGTFGVPIPAVPEPASWALMAGGLLAIGSASWRRTRRSLDQR